MNMDDETISAGGLRRDAMLRLRKLGWGSKSLARELGCSRTTVKRYLGSGRWQPYQHRASRGMLAGHEAWLRERFFRHRVNADLVRQDLAREHGIVASLRTVERAVFGFRQQLAAEARATMRFETPPGHHLQIDFGEKRVCSRRPSRWHSAMSASRPGSMAWRQPFAILAASPKRCCWIIRRH